MFVFIKQVNNLCCSPRMVLSAQAAVSLVQSEQKCPSDNYADDMFLGSVAKQLHWDVVQSSLVHQVQQSGDVAVPQSVS